ncbi:unnamed protein product [[Candida] boidinii]|nr:unnamed protein product [[Candida] boidinii]
MQAAMSATGSRRPGDLVNGIPSTALSRSLNDIGNIDVSYETPVSKKQNQNQQHQGYYGGPQQQPPQQQQRQQFYGGHPSNGVPPPNGFYQQQYQGSQEFHNNMYQQHHLQPQQHRNGSMVVTIVRSLPLIKMTLMTVMEMVMVTGKEQLISVKKFHLMILNI